LPGRRISALQDVGERKVKRFYLRAKAAGVDTAFARRTSGRIAAQPEMMMRDVRKRLKVGKKLR
jgi:hypothetical protein